MESEDQKQVVEQTDNNGEDNKDIKESENGEARIKESEDEQTGDTQQSGIEASAESNEQKAEPNEDSNTPEQNGDGRFLIQSQSV